MWFPPKSSNFLLSLLKCEICKKFRQTTPDEHTEHILWYIQIQLTLHIIKVHHNGSRLFDFKYYRSNDKKTPSPTTCDKITVTGDLILQKFIFTTLQKWHFTIVIFIKPLLFHFVNYGTWAFFKLIINLLRTNGL